MGRESVHDALVNSKTENNCVNVSDCSILVYERSVEPVKLNDVPLFSGKSDAAEVTSEAANILGKGVKNVFKGLRQ